MRRRRSFGNAVTPRRITSSHRASSLLRSEAKISSKSTREYVVSYCTVAKGRSRLCCDELPQLETWSCCLDEWWGRGVQLSMSQHAP